MIVCIIQVLFVLKLTSLVQYEGIHKGENMCMEREEYMVKNVTKHEHIRRVVDLNIQTECYPFMNASYVLKGYEDVNQSDFIEGCSKGFKKNQWTGRCTSSCPSCSGYGTCFAPNRCSFSRVYRGLSCKINIPNSTLSGTTAIALRMKEYDEDAGFEFEDFINSIYAVLSVVLGMLDFFTVPVVNHHMTTTQEMEDYAMEKFNEEMRIAGVHP